MVQPYKRTPSYFFQAASGITKINNPSAYWHEQLERGITLTTWAYNMAAPVFVREASTFIKRNETAKTFRSSVKIINHRAIRKDWCLTNLNKSVSHLSGETSRKLCSHFCYTSIFFTDHLPRPIFSSPRTRF